MNASEMTFGIEIECLLPVANVPEVGRRHAGRQIDSLPAGWNAQDDCSIEANNGYVGVEVVSPVLRGADGVAQIKAACEWLASLGARVNRSTGFHVHVGFNPTDAGGLAALVTVVANFEKAIYASTGTHSRERGTFCKTVQGSTVHRNGEYRLADRYHILNTTNLFLRGHGFKPTVEFRAFAGTINFPKIVAYVRMCLGLVEKSLKVKRLPKWVAKTPTAYSPIRRGGEGETAVTRLFYWLGWIKGRESYTFGAVGEEHVTIEECKKGLVRLARKYDAGDGS